MSECIECKDECGIYQRIHSNCYNLLNIKIELLKKQKLRLVRAVETAHDLIDQLCSKSVLTNDKDIPLLREYQKELEQALEKVKKKEKTKSL